MRRALLRRRHWSSWPALVLVLLVLTAATAGALVQLEHRSEHRARQQAIGTAQVISDLVVSRNVEPNDFVTGGLTPARNIDMQRDVAVLDANSRAEGLEVWALDGRLLFADAHHPTAETQLPRVKRDRARGEGAFVIEDGQLQREQPTLDVYLPYRNMGSKAVVGVVEVQLPEGPATRSIEQANHRFQAIAAALLLSVLGGLLALRRRLAKREHQARHDPLTGLLNRNALLSDAQAVLSDNTGSTALLVLDLDRFKTVNDTLGHAAGDALLVQVAATLRATLRPSDLVARLGGDEFAVVVSGLTDKPDPQRIAEHVLTRLRAGSFTVSGIALAVDASIGVALSPQHGDTIQELLQRADVAMYEAKRAHAGTAMYDPDSDHHDIGQLGVLVELRTAIEADQLFLQYQPQIGLADGDLVGVEALVRWQHPVRGSVPPAAFIPLAETTGLMLPLTEWVLRTAVRQAASWQRTGAPVRVAVNISPRTLVEGDLPALVLATLADAGLPACLLELEITETAVMADPERAALILRRLDAMGVRVSIDDFGAGYTSLSYLKTLPVKALKIDRGLVTHMLERPEDEAITEAVIGLGHKLGLEVLAEGIETEAVYQRLRHLTCDQAQGYLMSRPLSADAFEGWLTERTEGALTLAPWPPSSRTS